MAVDQSIGAGNTILVVDDEPVVLNLVCHVLSQAGFAVLKAACADEAIRLAVEHAGPIRLFLLDVVMPDMPGFRLAEHLQIFHPEAGLLFIAGLTDTPEIRAEIILRGRPLLAKPFFPRTLLEKVREVMPGAQRATASA